MKSNANLLYILFIVILSIGCSRERNIDNPIHTTPYPLGEEPFGTVLRDPAYSDVLKTRNQQELKDLFDRATPLKEGLVFPRDTFAVNADYTVLVAHTIDGKPLVLVVEPPHSGIGEPAEFEWITLERFKYPRSGLGPYYVLTHYDPNYLDAPLIHSAPN